MNKTDILPKSVMNEERLSPREQEICDLLVAGVSLKTIGESLFVSGNTVKFHRKNIYRKLGVNSLHELVKLCQPAGGDVPAAGEQGAGQNERGAETGQAGQTEYAGQNGETVEKRTGRKPFRFQLPAAAKTAAVAATTAVAVLAVVVFLLKPGMATAAGTDKSKTAAEAIARPAPAHPAYETVHLRASHWKNGSASGFNWFSDERILLRDIAHNVSRIEKEHNRYALTASGISNRDLDNVKFQVQGITSDHHWEFIAESYAHEFAVKAHEPFHQTVFLNNFHHNPNRTTDLSDYQNIVIKMINEFPGDPTPDGQVMATISNLTISLIDTR